VSVAGVARGIVDHRQTLLRYLIVGVASFVLDYGVLTVVYRGLHAPLWLSTTAGFWTSFVANFLLSRHWTFEVGHHASSTQLRRYGVLVATNYAITVVAVWLLHQAGASLLLAKAVTVAALTMTTFLAYRLWVFPPGDHP
jgi:putative flippase GtrA